MNRYVRSKKYEIIQFLSTYSVDTCIALTKHKQKLKHKQIMMTIRIEKIVFNKLTKCIDYINQMSYY